MRNFEQARDLWDTDRLEAVSDFIDSADRVVVRTIWRGVGRGPESHLEFTIVFTVRKGKIVHVEFFWIMQKPSKPWGCRSKTLKPTPEQPAGDFAGELQRS